MSCPIGVLIEDFLPVSITVHDPETGAKTDADSAPTYKVYANTDLDTIVYEGTMSKIDSASLTGFYFASIPCTNANGFLHDKEYTICIEAIVDSTAGGITYGFKAFEKLEIAIGIPIQIQGYDAYTGQPVQIAGHYK